MLTRMLAMDPSERITVEEALRHPYMADLHDPDDEPTALPFEEELEVISIGPARTALACGRLAGEELTERWQDPLLGATSTC